MKILSVGLGCVLLGLLPMVTQADTINVPGDQPSIQAGINVAQNGDTVLVANGTWASPDCRNLDFDGKAITVMSSGGADNCAIDCLGQGRGFIFQSTETSSAIVDGFTIVNGVSTGGDDDGGGILCKTNSNPIIRNCRIESCHAVDHGGGIAAVFSSPTIMNCYIYGCSSDGSGGGMYILGDVDVLGCTLDYNLSLDQYSHGQGGGIFYHDGNGKVHDCVFYTNGAERGAGVYCQGDVSFFNCLFYDNYTLGNNPADQAGAGLYLSDGNVFNCTFTNNNLPASGLGESIYVSYATSYIRRSILWDTGGNSLYNDGGTLSVTYSDVNMTSGTWPGTGNFDANPLFISGSDGPCYL
ncbi:MAG TPA: right-handed parallel beta-helix repeat-containing protein, partial [bacterium]|nr:right-handed parallel beta-helix repeat-containing protein [bacterium]